MNFHFNPNNPNKSNLMQQLQKIDRQLDQDKKKLVEQKKLEAEFYEDSNNNKNLNLADEIMNQLLKDNGSNKVNNNSLMNNNSKPYEQYSSNNAGYQQPQKYMYQNLNNFNHNQIKQIQSPVYSNAHNNNLIQNNSNNNNPYNNNNQYQNHRGNNFQQQNINVSSPAQHQNRFMNKRQLDKQKLQNQVQESSPFLSNNTLKRSEQKYKINNAKPIQNQRELQKLKLQQQSNQNNPFLFDNNKRNKSYERGNLNGPVNIQPQQAYQNPRQLQKLKLQNYSNNNNNQYDKPSTTPGSPLQGQQNGPQSISKKIGFESRYSNPFQKDEEFIRQKKEQQQRQYRRVLEEQKKIEEERKKEEKKMVKQEKYAYNNYKPDESDQRANSPTRVQSPDNLPKSKKVDPNGKPPVYNYSQKFTTSSDLQYMRMKASELTEKHKKGKIDYEQYHSDINKLAEFYKIDPKELLDKKGKSEENQELPWIAQAKRKQEQKGKGQSLEKDGITQRKPESKYDIIEHDQSLEKFPDSESMLKNQSYGNQYGRNPSTENYKPYPHYQQYGGNDPNLSNAQSNFLYNNPPLSQTAFMQQFPQMDHGLIKTMLEQLNSMRNDYTKSLQNEKKFLQETFFKFMNQMQQQQLLNTQQMQQQSSNSYINQPYKASPKKKYNNFVSQSSQEHIIADQSLLDYNNNGDKSLSGIANKIPFKQDPSFIVSNTNNNKPYGSKKQQNLDQFFTRNYKIKQVKKFSIVVDENQSTMEIPNVSNFLALKNGKDAVNKLFEEDLIMMKKIQREKEVNKLRNRVQEQNNYADTFSNPKNITINNKDKNRSEYIVENQSMNEPKNNSYEDYQNYSRNKKQRDVKSAQINHRVYKRVNQNYEEMPSNAFIKKHVSAKEQEENLPNFADQSDIKFRSPVYFSPKLNSEILQQDEYQTQQKSKQLLESQFYGQNIGFGSGKGQVQRVSPKVGNSNANQMKKKNYAYENSDLLQKKQKSVEYKKQENKSKQNKKVSSPSKISMLNIIQSNNEALSKYQQPTPKNIKDNEQQQVDIKQYSSINSNRNKQQEQDLKHYFNNQNQGGQKNTSSDYLSNKFNTQKQYEQINNYNDQYQQSLQTVKSHEESISMNKKSPKKPTQQNFRQSHEGSVQYSQSYHPSQKKGSINYSQTIESIQQSSGHLRPPLNKKKSSSKKKQSSLIRTKIQKQSILYKPPSSQSQQISHLNESQRNEEPLKFDSHVYDSQYDETLDAKALQKRIQNLQKQQRQKNRHSKSPEIKVNTPVLLMPGNISNMQQSKGSLSGVGKLTFAQARNLAKQSKKKSNIPVDNYDQKISQLQSMLSKRDESFSRQVYKSKQTKQNPGYQQRKIKLGLQDIDGKKGKVKNDKNIMNLLEDLQNQSAYRSDFESYREDTDLI